jgi:exopolysaccharide biosynthesis polyprenyl glycosylphosphotransferase
VFGLLWLTAIIFCTLGRALLLEIEQSLYSRGKELRNAVIIGSNATANRIFETLNNHPLLGYRLEGYFAESHVGADAPLSRARHLGTIADVAPKLVSEHIELVMMAMDAGDHEAITRVVNECEGVNVEFLMVPDILELMAGNFMVREIEGIPFLRLKGVPMTTWGRILKRTFDAGIAAILLLLFSPVLLAIALLIKLDSRGPVLFRQERIGIDGRNFDMLKFRSMKAEAESKSGPVFAREDDPRRTAIGTFLRKSSLDEFPQLINVLRGEMSLVGPRPERPFFVDRFKDNVPKYLDRHRVKTGMTGWAQVNGLRGNTSIEERIKYDVYYIENWSLWLDVKILLRTVRALFPSKHAY